MYRVIRDTMENIVNHMAAVSRLKDFSRLQVKLCIYSVIPSPYLYKQHIMIRFSVR